MVIQAMKVFFGWSEELIQDRLEGFVSDGVYQGKRTRVTGGGYLSLGDHLEEQLELAPGLISDLYDMGHSDQLTLADILIKNTENNQLYKEITEPVFNMMAEFKNHKSQLLFEEVAAQCRAPVIANCGRQDTRWVRALIKALEAFF